MVIFLVWIGIVYFMVANGADVAIRVDIVFLLMVEL